MNYNVRIFTIAMTAISLVSCAQVTQGLKTVNEGLAVVNGKSAESESQDSGLQRPNAKGTPQEVVFAAKNGTTYTATVNVPTRSCEPERYVNAFQRGYVNTWNGQINNAGIKYSGSRKKEDVAAAAVLDGKRLNSPPKMPVQTMEETKKYNRISSGCDNNDSSGNTEGMAQGYNAVLAELSK